jgi:hypothetical protein
MSSGIPGRGDFKAFLSCCQAALENPGAVDRLLQLCERNERAVAQFQHEQGEIRIAREEHERHLRQKSREHDEQIKRARAEWAAEEARRRLQLEADEREAMKLRERAEKDGQAAAALRCELEQKSANAWLRDPVGTAQQAEQEARL